LRLLQDAIRDAWQQPDPSVPLNEPKVARILDDYAQGCRDAVFEDDLPWLRGVAKERRLRVANQNLIPRIAKLLDTAVVMTYRNGAAWVDVSYPVQKLL
jgi:hypothetical protein